jgi:hypothetical protein
MRMRRTIMWLVVVCSIAAVPPARAQTDAALTVVSAQPIGEISSLEPAGAAAVSGRSLRARMSSPRATSAGAKRRLRSS